MKSNRKAENRKNCYSTAINCQRNCLSVKHGVMLLSLIQFSCLRHFCRHSVYAFWSSQRRLHDHMTNPAFPICSLSHFLPMDFPFLHFQSPTNVCDGVVF